jgi:choline dehydrogenase-like flavoprotein
MNVYDYIVVGGGSAGCTVTHRLVKAGKSILMIEAGPDDDNQFVRIPGGFVRLFTTERVQFYMSEPQASVGGRPVAVPQGRTLGGGSSVNAMIYIRGTPKDYDEWRDMGNPGWGWDDVRRCSSAPRPTSASPDRCMAPRARCRFRTRAIGILSVSPDYARRRRPAIPTTTTSMAPLNKASAFIRSRSARPPRPVESCAIRAIVIPFGHRCCPLKPDPRLLVEG